MGSECCKFERDYETEIVTLESDLENSRELASYRKSKTTTEIDFLSTNKQYNILNSDLKKILTNKFQLIDKNIKFEEIKPKKFENILNRNIFCHRIISNLKEDLKNMKYEEDNIAYKDIIPIKIFSYKKGNEQYYQGSFDSEGKAHGKGIWIKNSNIYFGNFSNDKFNGKGLFINTKGNYYFGEWKDNKIEGKGEFIIDSIETYKGNLKENKKNGTGVENYKNYDVYYGEFIDNKRNGKGKYLFSNGDIYEGEFKNSNIEGKGKINFKDGKKYEGDLKGGKMEGKGEFTYDNGIKFRGKFIRNKKEGKGEYIWPDGKIFQGYWKNDIPEGKGIFKDLDNEIFEEIIYNNGIIRE